MPTFSDLWSNHPGSGTQPCDASFENQCAIRMSDALVNSGVDTGSFDAMFPGRRCWFGHGHILAAEEMANWLATQAHLFGTPKVIRARGDRRAGIRGKQGIVFIKDGWELGGDHIDLWDRRKLKAGPTRWLNKGSEIRFWTMG